MRRLFAALTLTAVFATSACGSSDSSGAAPPASPPPSWHVSGGFVRDPDGRAVLARGMNLAGAHKKPPFFGYHQPVDYARVHDDWGMSALRFLVSWAAIEPEKGVYDETYLDEVAKRMQWAKDAGLLVILDMHQDVFGLGFDGNGAPLWACDASRYATYQPQESWFFNYLTKEVTACFDDFYASAELRAHYAGAWRKLAERVVQFDNVIGFDPMNEPFWGSAPMATFERDTLQPFYEEVTVELRKAAPHWIGFFEPATTKNIGMATSLEPFHVPNVVYAPHGYDVSAEQKQSFSPDGRDAYLKKLKVLADDAAELGVPLWIGEYGGIATSSGIDVYMDTAYEAAGSMAAANMYWSYDKGDGYGPLGSDGSERTLLLDAIVRPYPERVAGDLVSFAHDRTAGVFTTTWKQDPSITAPTIISAPARAFPNGFDVSCAGCESHVEGGRLYVTKAPAGTVTLTLTRR